MSRGRKYIVAVIIITSLFIAYLHYSTGLHAEASHSIYTELYYFPVLLGALVFGLRGALLTFLLIIALSLPYIALTWTGEPSYEVNRLFHLFLEGFFAFLAGYLVDRDKKIREQLDRERYLAGIGRIATTIVHDLKNQVMAIQGFTRRLEQGKDPETALEAIHDSAKNMDRIVRDVLDFAKPIRLELRDEDLRTIIERTGESLREKGESVGVSILTKLPEAPVVIPVDRVHMQRALTNLLGNAIEASRSGQQVTVSLKIERNYLALFIKDQGAGMDQETIRNIFTPFYTKRAGGVGLGMAIARKIVEGHQGEIRVESQLGAGTEITILLPYKTRRHKAA